MSRIIFDSELLRLIDRYRQQYPRLTADQQKATRRAIQAAFAAAQGWQLVNGPGARWFNLAELALNAYGDRRYRMHPDHWELGARSPLVDHVEWYASDRRPAALVSHAYVTPWQAKGYDLLELPPGVVCTVLPCPSWYNPAPICTAVLITARPAPEILAKVRKTNRRGAVWLPPGNRPRTGGRIPDNYLVN